MSTTRIAADIGPVVTGSHIEASVINTLRLWLPSYLAECSSKCGLERGALPEPKGWTITGRGLEKFTSDQLPCIVVMATGIIAKPLSDGYPGTTRATWHVDVGTIFNAAWGDMSRAHAQLYVRALSLVLMQRPLEGLACAVDVTGETYDEVDFSDTRTYSAAAAGFNIEVEDSWWRSGGPPPYVEPPDDPMVPFDPWVTVTDTGVTVDNTPPITEDYS